MSIATFESPVTESQLFFSWVENEGADVSDFYSEDVAAPAAAPAAVRFVTPSTLGPKKHVDRLSARTSGARNYSAPSDLLQPVTQAKLAVPVRLGTVMLQLLRSYGVTEEEIAEGLAAYEAKHRLAQAG